MKKSVKTDIVIIGGGIAGLWLLNRLRQLGYSVILLESNTLGGGQTHKAQGIIHGGMKYALAGEATSSMEAIADMPKVWQKCLRGQGEIDLTHVPVLSEQQYLWSPNALAAKLAGFFAGLALKGNIKTLSKEEFPELFQHPKFKGQVYSLDEIVIDVNSLVRELVKPNQDVIFKMDPFTEEALQIDATGRLVSLDAQVSTRKSLQIQAQKYIFTAGSGNELLIKKLIHVDIATQRRPLHMVLVKTSMPYSLYAHCLGLGMTPRITITTHKMKDGNTAWYLGGQLAEEGVKRSATEQIQEANKELCHLFPWLDFSTAQFATFRVDRAEPLQPGGKRPDSVCVEESENIMVAWPTKLAFAPKLAAEIIQRLQSVHIQPGVHDVRELRSCSIPCLAKPIWEELL